MSSPWVDRFSDRLDDRTIYSLATVSPSPADSLGSMALEVAAPHLKNRLQSIYLPSQNGIEILRVLLGRAMAFSAERYGSNERFLSELYSSDKSESFPVCLTGLAGVGKTQLINALWRLLPKDEPVDPGHGHQGFIMRSAWRVKAKPAAEMLKEVLGRKGKSAITSLIKDAQLISRRDGVSLIVIDELQFYSMGQEASAAVTKAIFEFSKIGIPLVYVSNYSLCNKFFSRPDHDQHRLLSDPLILLPDDRNGRDWKNYVDECARVSGGILRLDKAEDVLRFYNYCFGLRRLAVDLIAIAYALMRGEKASFIGIDHIYRAYTSAQFGSSRQMVDLIVKPDIENKKARADLWCPSTIPLSKSQQFSETCRQIRQERMADEMLMTSLSKSEKRGLNEIKEAVVAKPAYSGVPQVVDKGSSRSTLSELISRAEAKRKKDKDE
jgi:DNA replication protein DnaC